MARELQNQIAGYRAAATFATLLFVLLAPRGAEAYVPDDRWSVTASGATGASGTPIKLTWSFAPDGTNIPGEGASNLVSYFDGLFNVTAGGSDLTQRPWFTYFKQSFDRWTALGGITFTYESHDNGVSLQTSSGVLGVRGDVRLGGALVDGPSNTLAYTWLPNSGDMVVDTGETNFYTNSSNGYRQLRNTLMHEIGHAFGLLHTESSTDALLMEPIINLGIDGPQLDDIRGIQGLYGDVVREIEQRTGQRHGGPRHQSRCALARRHARRRFRRARRPNGRAARDRLCEHCQRDRRRFLFVHHRGAVAARRDAHAAGRHLQPGCRGRDANVVQRQRSQRSDAFDLRFERHDAPWLGESPWRRRSRITERPKSRHRGQVLRPHHRC